MRYLKFICFALFLSMTSVTYAQKDTILHKEVEVTKAYQPIIRDAQKISIIPANNDTVTTKPTFGYSIQSKPGQLARTPTSIAAANLANESETRSGLGYLKAGLGNYLTSYAELFLNKPQSENTAFGMHFKHLASGGDIKLANGSNVDAPFSQNGISMFAKQFFQSSALSFDLGYNRDRITYYGLP
ncbi:MAG: hypothetical protein Q8862_05125, partial [Bacteroidota bacterium]|nr:hypothetical protein [Bacteroidota bacterium]